MASPEALALNTMIPPRILNPKLEGIRKAKPKSREFLGFRVQVLDS